MTFSRVRAVVVIAVLFVAASIVVILAIRQDTQSDASISKCAPGEIPVSLDMPVPQDITVNVINASGKPNQADQVTKEFANRGFKVGTPATDPENRVFDQEVAVIVYGPGAIGAAWEIRAYFLLEATMDFRIDRVDMVDETGAVTGSYDNTVDVFIGQRFLQLATTTEVNQAIGQIGRLDPEDGTCEA